MRYSLQWSVWYHCRSRKEPGDGFRRWREQAPKKKETACGGFVILESSLSLLYYRQPGEVCQPPGSSGYTELRRLPVTIPRRTKQKAQWITTAASLPSTIQQAAVAGAEPRGGCLLPFSACGGHGRIVLSAQSRIAWPTRLRVDRRARPTRPNRTKRPGLPAQGSERGWCGRVVAA